MIFEELKKIVDSKQQEGLSELYIRNLLKEHAQMYVLNFISTHEKYNKKFIFTGGTCLRHIYGLDRLSEDLDFDYIHDFDISLFKAELQDYFVKRYQYRDIQILLKSRGRRIECKFPVLKKLGLAEDNESDFLIVKLELSKIPTKEFTVVRTPQNKFGFSFILMHYDLPSLFAGKLHAIFTRRRFTGSDNRKTIKGRDYYDLIWFLEKNIIPHLPKLSAQLGKEITPRILETELDKKVDEISSHYLSDLESDLIPFISNHDVVVFFRKTFKDEYLKNKNYLCTTKN